MRSALLCVVVAVLVVGSAPAPVWARYATGGSGLYRGSIDWFEWGNAGDAIPAGGLTKTNTRTVAGKSLDTTCVMSNVVGAISAYRPGNYVGDALDDLYNIGGTGTSNELISGLANATAAATVSFDFSCAVTYDGQVVPLRGLVMADAEQTNTGEYVQATPGQAATWRVIDRFRSCGTSATQATLAGDGTLRLDSLSGTPCAGGTGPTVVGFMDGATSAHVEVKGGGKSAVAVGAVLDADFGDAPTSYGQAGAFFDPAWQGGTVPVGATDVSTNGFTLGTPAQGSGPRLGALIDAESSPQPSADADGDDTDGSADEDSVTPPGSITVDPGSTFTLPNIACGGSAFVAGWIDWNRNGTFDPAEGVTPKSCTAGSVDLSWTMPTTTKTGRTYLRLRAAATSAAAGKSIGLATSGEVEDFAIDLNPGPATAHPATTSGYGVQHTTISVGANGSITLLDSGGNPTDTVTILGKGVYHVDDPATGVITFTPEDDFTGAAPAVTYQLTDTTTPTATVTTSTYTATVLTAPTTASPAMTAGRGVQKAMVTIPPGGSITLLTKTGNPTNKVTITGQGVYQLNPPTGVITFTPAPGFLGTATAVAFRVADAFGQLAASTYTARVLPTAVRPALPVTGAPAALPATGGMLLVVLGILLLATTRRRTTRS
ncbi:CshA/CshB family fibrillar adhesin-related protein [Krasilnikovia cinnamomea]|uniref:CshA/CshB family fibrillar adhesin-related protein n=1 Tax=Krasilnikovia cinnamomea TaxID=349313 RepID=UPI00102CCD2B|nr:CshA/CshB family fibrillar adhesin-related protein [Krasilnikovia cinnamomea]